MSGYHEMPAQIGEKGKRGLVQEKKKKGKREKSKRIKKVTMKTEKKHVQLN